MVWSQYNPVRILAGSGCRNQLGALLPGAKALLVTTEGMWRRGTAKAVMDACPAITWSAQSVPPNPDLDMLDTVAGWHRDAPLDAIVALGGGSAMDSAKALAAIVPMQGEAPLSGWLREEVPRGNVPVLPIFCLPTTAGTGAEVTPFGTIWDTAHTRKRSVAHPALYPQAALLDPELTLSLPWHETYTGAMDILSHCLETLWNTSATPVSLALARYAIPQVMENLPLVEKDPLDIAARARLQNASLLAGLAISQSRTAIAHAISYPVSLAFGVPHGLACAFTLPAIAAMVSRHGAWPGPDMQKLGEDAAAFVAESGIRTVMREYCTAEAACRHADAMIDPKRPDTFVVPVDRDAIVTLLQCSLE